MALEWLGFYFIVCLQVLAGIQLLRTTVIPRRPARILAALFLLNAAMTAIMLLPRADPVWLRSDPGWATAIFRALDAPTGALLLAFVAARSRQAWGARAATILIAAGVLHGGLELLMRDTLPLYDHYLRSPPYYVGLALSTYVLAGGAAWERWISLAFLGRAFYWGAGGVLDLVTDGWGSEAVVVLNRAGLLGMTIACTFASLRLLRGSGAPHGGTVAIGLAIGPAAVLLEAIARAAMPPDAPFWYGSVMLVNLVTLGLTRPIFTLLGVAPAALPHALLRAAAAGISGMAATALMTPLANADGTGWVLYGVGLLVALLALVVLEGAASAGPAPAAAPEAAPPRVDAAPARDDPPIAPRRPQWQEIVLALRGSCLPAGVARAGEPHLTQKQVVARTGIPAPRVSRLASELNEDAASRLDAFVPGWRDAHRSANPPALLEHFRGAVEASPGVWVYYRLTPLGERLAAALAADAPSRPAAASAAADAVHAQ